MLSTVYNKVFGKSEPKTKTDEDESESRTVETGVGDLSINEKDSEKKQDSGGETESKGNGDKTACREIIKEDITLPKCFKGKLAFVLHNVFSKEECADYIKKTEKMGYTEALVNVGGGRQRMIKDVRNNSRCIWDSFEEADRIWQRIKPFIPSTWADRDCLGLNERLRFLRYDPGEFFASHMDGQYVRDNGERSYITIQLYLNEGFKGGSTTFMNFAEEERKEVVPKTGMVLVFQHDIMHEGSLLKKGRKYSMRTDIMYTKASHDSRVNRSKPQ